MINPNAIKRGIYTNKFLINICQFNSSARSPVLRYQALLGLSVC